MTNEDNDDLPETSYDVSKLYPCEPHLVAHMVGDYSMVGHGDTEADARADWRRLALMTAME